MSISSLRKSLHNLREFPAHHERCFVPEGSLEIVFTKEIIHNLLSAENLAQIVDEVHSTALKVLAALIWTDSDVKLLKLFLNKGLCDQRLPFTKQDLGQDLIEALGGERPVNTFLHIQHAFLATVFSKGADYDSIVLPFVENERIGQGAFGTVYKIRIPSNHQRLQVSTDGIYRTGWFARKEVIATGCGKTFEREKRTLQQLHKLEHPNIMPLLATYSHNDHFNMIFPLADMTLHDYLHSDGGKFLDDRSTISLFRKAYDLAEALDHIHNFSFMENGEEFKLLGYHHDLKPRNILVLEGRFMVADFGHANFKNIDQTSKTQWKFGTKKYSPPETRDGKVGRAYDIWSLGCVLAELTTFAITGAEGIDAFTRRRTTKVSTSIENDYFHDGTNVKPEVLEHFCELKLMTINRPVSHAIVSQVLDLVEQMLEPDIDRRPVSGKVVEKLGKILDTPDHPSEPTTLSPIISEPPSYPQIRNSLAPQSPFPPGFSLDWPIFVPVPARNPPSSWIRILFLDFCEWVQQLFARMDLTNRNVLGFHGFRGPGRDKY